MKKTKTTRRREAGRGRRICPSNRHSAVEPRVGSSASSAAAAAVVAVLKISCYTVAFAARPSVRPPAAAANPGFQFPADAAGFQGFHEPLIKTVTK